VARATIVIECGFTSGLGRVRRSLTLAAALEQQGLDILVVLSSSDGITLANSLGFNATLTMPDDISDDLVIIDTCSQTGAEVDKICRSARISLVIDDLAERPITCDYLVNPNFYAPEISYTAYNLKKKFLGSGFALVAQEFFDSAKPASERNGVVVSFGGTDNGELALPVVLALLDRTSTNVIVPVPDYVEPTSALTALAETSHHVSLIRGADMPHLLGNAQVFVGAAGATVLEALAAGCQVCATATQADQHKNVAYLPKVGVMSLPTYNPESLADMASDLIKKNTAHTVLNNAAAHDIAATITHSFHG